MAMLTRILLYLLVVGTSISFALLNSTKISVNLFFSVFNISIATFFAGSLSLGVFLGLIAMLFKHFRMKLTIRKLQSQLKNAELEIQNLRVMPFRDN